MTIVFSMKDKRIQDCVLREVKLTLKRAVDICKSSEVTRKEVQTMKKGPVESTKVVYEVNSKLRVKHKPKPDSAVYQHKKSESMKSGRCGRQHPPKRCPAWGKSGLKCGRRNHFAEMCRTKSVKELVQVDERDDNQFFLDTLFIGNIEKADKWHAVIRCNETRVTVKLDTGAATNVMVLGTLIKITPKPQIKPSNTVLRAYGCQRVTHIGKCQLECWVNGRNKQCEFYIVNSVSPPILGLAMCDNLGLIIRGVKGVEAVTTESINSTYKDVCNGQSCFEEPYHIVVDQDTVPVKEPPRRVPLGLQDRLKLKLDLMEKHKVIQKVNKPPSTHRLEDISSSECHLDFAQRQKSYRRECTKHLVTWMMCT